MAILALLLLVVNGIFARLNGSSRMVSRLTIGVRLRISIDPRLVNKRSSGARLVEPILREAFADRPQL